MHPVVDFFARPRLPARGDAGFQVDDAQIRPRPVITSPQRNRVMDFSSPDAGAAQLISRRRDNRTCSFPLPNWLYMSMPSNNCTQKEEVLPIGDPVEVFLLHSDSKYL